MDWIPCSDFEPPPPRLLLFPSLSKKRVRVRVRVPAPLTEDYRVSLYTGNGLAHLSPIPNIALITSAHLTALT